jgi:hypothetical protein
MAFTMFLLIAAAFLSGVLIGYTAAEGDHASEL